LCTPDRRFANKRLNSKQHFFFCFFFFCNDQHKAVSVARDLKQMCDGLPDPGARFRNVAKEELERLVVQGQAVKTAAHIAYLVE
jgi:hypothetical protein